VLDVVVRLRGMTPILAVVDAAGNDAGSLTFVGYLELIDCIQNRGFDYQATIIQISGGAYEVKVEPK
jgi:hypothetical protein